MSPYDSDIATAIARTLESPNEPDRNMENGNVVDGLFEIARAITRLADAIRLAANQDRS